MTQETFYQAILSMSRYRGDCKESVWLCQIAKHVWDKHIKKEEKYVYINQEEWEQISLCDTGFEQSIFEMQDKITVYRHMKLLPKEMQELVYFRLTGELSFSEIGELMDHSEQWARTNYYRAKEKLVKTSMLNFINLLFTIKSAFFFL